ncbi:MAG: zinc ribbon domain-containing protein [Oscillospiraceae bacterium]|nr:zinc ribbon domain-containing protein [Oscillospiraceae bacterium]
MYCVTCGYFIEDGFRFCANCGEAVRQAPTAPPGPSAVISVPAEPDETAELSESFGQGELSEAQLQMIDEFIKPEPAAEKLYFGKGAFVFCLAVVAVLSIISGVFIGLYITDRNGRSETNGGGVGYGQYR